jgi:chromate transporter
MSAITAAVVGVILNLAVWFGLHVLFGEVRQISAGPWSMDIPVLSSVILPSLVLTAIAAISIFRFGLSVIATLLGSAVLGICWSFIALS